MIIKNIIFLILGLSAAILVLGFSLTELYRSGGASQAGAASSLVPSNLRMDVMTVSANERAAENFVAVEKAKEIGAACVTVLDDLSRIVVDTGQAAVSTWHKETPSQRAFVALNFLRYPNQAIAPRAVVVLEATPTRDNHCDAMDMRVQPSRLSCNEIAVGLDRQKSPVPQLLGDVALYQPLPSGQRVILLPTATTGCVVITTGSYYGP